VNLMTVDEVADQLRVSARTVRRYVESGGLEAMRFGRGYRISSEALDQFMRGSVVHRRPSPPEVSPVSSGQPVTAPSQPAVGRGNRKRKRKRR
jgi:excisionase family DNA binding protein